eukprot:TRINITY_DN38841_c0_g1_i1.p1 TRINITY_DN38841_c0_g1~~TRINITY_DN38841_c0_g1_i1.p1  ORF type:complete len:312 (-),score=74.32 TRINITY_DN38841_c0_g1_i1:23-958(-)
MQPSRGIFGATPEDGVLRGRIGAKRWIIQTSIVFTFALASGVVILILILNNSLVPLLVLASLSVLLCSSLKVCIHPWAWLGVDNHLPVFFDLQQSGLEVGTWNYFLLQRRYWPRSALRDLRVFKEAVDCSAASGRNSSDAAPLQSSEKVHNELPHCGDAAKECFSASWRSCCTGSRAAPVSGVFLGARVDTARSTEVVRLSRNVWSLSGVEALLALAREARQLVGLPEEIPKDPLPAGEGEAADVDGDIELQLSERIQVVVDTLPKEIYGKEVTSWGDLEGSSKVETVEAGAPRPKMKAKVKFVESSIQAI